MSLSSHHQDQTQKKFYKFLRRTVQLVLSVSLFSLFVWYSSGFSILPQSFNAYFSTCLFSMLTRTLERKYMFLIFNAILAFLAKTSLSSSSSPPISSAFDIELHQPLKEEPFSPESTVPLMVEQEHEQVDKQEEYYQEEDEDGPLLLTQVRARENENSVIIAEEEDVQLVGKDKEDEEDRGTGVGVTVTQDDDELAADTTMVTNEELANTDELNRKFEEFIRKMKKEIRIEAQTHPIAV